MVLLVLLHYLGMIEFLVWVVFVLLLEVLEDISYFWPQFTCKFFAEGQSFDSLVIGGFEFLV